MISHTGLCDINEGSATSEDRCKSPTSGNISFSLSLKERSGEYSRNNGQTVKQSEIYLENHLRVLGGRLMFQNSLYSYYCCNEVVAHQTWTLEVSSFLSHSRVWLHSTSFFKNALFQLNIAHLWIYNSFAICPCFFFFLPLCRVEKRGIRHL